MISVLALLLLIGLKRVPEPLVILGAGVVGLTLKHGWI
jgi:hypothetical protein